MSVRRLRDLPTAEFAASLQEGAVFDYGAARVRVRSRVTALAAVLQDVYGAAPWSAPQTDFVDYHVQVVPGAGVRRWWSPQCRFLIDGVMPFDPFPLGNALPLYEWGVNWCFAQRANHRVLLHAGVLARDGRGVILAAPPGSGKSTLSAALMLRGFRLLSDEFGVLEPGAGLVHAMLKPVALKNASIAVIRDFSAAARIGRTYPGTRKGDVAHLAPTDACFDALHEAVRPALVVFPRFLVGRKLTCTVLSPEDAFARLAFNSFNYPLLGRVAFDAVADVIESCVAVELVYDDLDAAIAQISTLLAQAPA